MASAKPAKPRAGKASAPRLVLPNGEKDATVELGDRKVRLTNLKKPFWPELGVTKGDLLQYYADVAPVLLPHVAGRAMVMRRYPNGAYGEAFFMKRCPTPRPEWVELCLIDHGSKGVIDFPIVQDLATLLWIVNLGCIDLNPWYARCDGEVPKASAGALATDLPDWLHFDLDPVPGASFDTVREAAIVVHEALDALGMQNHAKTTGSRGIHVYVPIVKGPTQKQVWTFSKTLAVLLAGRRPDLLTAEYAIATRPKGRVLVDFNQNSWERTLASIYSVRPKPHAPVSTPVTWDEIAEGIRIEDFRIDNVRARIAKVGDLWAPLLGNKGRVKLDAFPLGDP